MDKEKERELVYRLRMLEQQTQNLQEQLQAVEQGIVELSELDLGLDELKGGEGKELLSQIGRGIFVKSKLASEELTVDIGGKNFVKKSIPQTKEIIEEQLKKLEAVKKELEKGLENAGEEMTASLEEFRKTQE